MEIVGEVLHVVWSSGGGIVQQAAGSLDGRQRAPRRRPECLAVAFQSVSAILLFPLAYFLISQIVSNIQTLHVYCRKKGPVGDPQEHKDNFDSIRYRKL